MGPSTNQVARMRGLVVVLVMLIALGMVVLGVGIYQLNTPCTCPAISSGAAPCRCAEYPIGSSLSIIGLVVTIVGIGSLTLGRFLENKRTRGVNRTTKSDGLLS